MCIFNNVYKFNIVLYICRSYRNPNPAEILADFESAPPPSRPKTVPAVSINQQRQPFVPAPYFYRHTNKPATAGANTKKRNSPSSLFEGRQSCLLHIAKLPNRNIALRGSNIKTTF